MPRRVLRWLVHLAVVVTCGLAGAAPSDLFGERPDGQPPRAGPATGPAGRPTPPPPPSVAATARPVPPRGPIDLLAGARPVRVDRRDGPQGVELRGDGLVETAAEYPVPLEINATVRTTDKNVRLYYGRGVIILNWEMNADDLRFHDPATGGHVRGVGNGRIPDGRWVQIRWLVEDGRTTLFVDGRERMHVDAPYKGFVGRVGIGSWGDSTVTVRSFTATPLGRAGPDGPPVPPGGPPAVDASAFAGVWRGRWNHGGEGGHYTFAGDRFTSSGGASARFKVEDGAVTIDHAIAQPGTRDLNRFTPAGRDQLLLESWPSVEAYRAGGRATHFGVATRVPG
jgi:hypothetical protein